MWRAADGADQESVVFVEGGAVRLVDALKCTDQGTTFDDGDRDEAADRATAITFRQHRIAALSDIQSTALVGDPRDDLVLTGADGHGRVLAIASQQ